MLLKTLSGAVCTQWIRCDRPGCRCARGELHGRYYACFWRENGRLRKQYVKRRDVEQVRAQCQARRQARQELATWRQVWREMTTLVREVEHSCPR